MSATKTVSIEADAVLDALQKLEIFHHSLTAIARSLGRHGLQPEDIMQLRESAAGLEALRGSLAEALPPLPPTGTHAETVRIAWRERADATRESVAQAQALVRALGRMAAELEEEAVEARQFRRHLDPDSPDSRLGMIYTDARLGPMAQMAGVLQRAADEMQQIAHAQKNTGGERHDD
ncbi:hypothetical protein [Halomonas sp. Y3]|uniref:hypothetical protein n=1 Tax=Halomonas sp. Y3 TaxID=2956797 RepID=UPI00209E10AA|nr:hypothetical protein [Halomonas sp. Y3]